MKGGDEEKPHAKVTVPSTLSAEDEDLYSVSPVSNKRGNGKSWQAADESSMHSFSDANEKDKGRDSDDDDDRSRDRSESRDKDRRSQSQDTDRGRSCGKRRSRSRDKSLSQSRDKSRSRSRDKGRSQSRDKGHSRSRDKGRSRSGSSDSSSDSDSSSTSSSNESDRIADQAAVGQMEENSVDFMMTMSEKRAQSGSTAAAAADETEKNTGVYDYIDIFLHCFYTHVMYVYLFKHSHIVMYISRASALECVYNV